jgi:glyoxylase-like metal-dependent hydrolase (beta-lactamase superfamily II)
VFTEAAPGVFSFDHDFVEGHNGIVLGQRTALAIDGGNYPKDGQAMADFIRARGFVADRLALTHGHGDHILGAAPLAGGEVFAHALTPGVMRRQIAGWAARWGQAQTQVAQGLCWPTVTYSDELSLDLGGKTVRFIPTPGHSEDGVSAWVEEDQVLIGGDAVVTGIVPAIGDGDGRALEKSLRRLAQLKIKVLIPGHGPLVYGVEATRACILWEADYLAGVRARVVQALAQMLPDAVAAVVSFDEFVGDRLPADRHNMPKRHRNTVEKIITEERNG